MVLAVLQLLILSVFAPDIDCEAATTLMISLEMWRCAAHSLQMYEPANHQSCTD